MNFQTRTTTLSNIIDSDFDFSFMSSLEDIGKNAWESLCGQEYPFLRYAFLNALEHTGCANTQSGWQAHHLCIKQNNNLVGVMPLYLKHHSYGEYVFDWAWADAYHRHGLDYYPKLLSAIPYTPATGPRLCLDSTVCTDDLIAPLCEAIKKECEKLNASSWHGLFPTQELHQQFADQGFSARRGCQFHWLNQDFESFDDFLSTFNSRKRKNLKKERRVVAAQNITVVTKEGADISDAEWRQFYQFYHLTYFKRSGRQGYLNQAFFLSIAEHMPEHIVMIQAQHNNAMVAAALCFKGGDTLYGRYWGCAQEFDMLHFECCYYRGIEYAIEHQLQRFDPGAQGEHKIQRGFTPVPTYSNHWIAREDFRVAIDRFLQDETAGNQQYLENAQSYLPFKQTTHCDLETK